MANYFTKNINKKIKDKRREADVLLIAAIVLLAALLAVSTFVTYKTLLKPVLPPTPPPFIPIEPKLISKENATLIAMNIPAVSAEDVGVITTLLVEALPGTGRILVDIDNLLFWADTQHSMRIARLVAANVTGKNIEDYDFIYNIIANASIIGGPSAGAAIAIATIAALENKSIAKDVMITGTINHDGTIGPVSKILQKAQAAKDANATIFLVPLLQSRDVVYETKKYCEKFGWTEICTIETIPRKVYVGETVNITVKEVSDIHEALEYFIPGYKVKDKAKA